MPLVPVKSGGGSFDKWISDQFYNFLRTSNEKEKATLQLLAISGEKQTVSTFS